MAHLGPHVPAPTRMSALWDQQSEFPADQRTSPWCSTDLIPFTHPDNPAGLLSIRELKLTTELLDVLNWILIKHFPPSLRKSLLPSFFKVPHQSKKLAICSGPSCFLPLPAAAPLGETVLACLDNFTSEATSPRDHTALSDCGPTLILHHSSGTGELTLTSLGSGTFLLLQHTQISAPSHTLHTDLSVGFSLVQPRFPPEASYLRLLKLNYLLFSSLIRPPLQVTLLAQSSPAGILFKLGCSAMLPLLSEEQKCLLVTQPSITSFLDVTHSLLEKVQRKYRLSRKPHLILKYVAPECSTDSSSAEEVVRREQHDSTRSGDSIYDLQGSAGLSSHLAQVDRSLALSGEVLSDLNHSMTSTLAHEVTRLLSAKLNVPSSSIPQIAHTDRHLDFRHLQKQQQQQPTNGSDPQGDGQPAEDSLQQASSFTQTFLQSVVASVDSRDPVVANAWMETLLDVIDLLPLDIIHRNILRLAVSRGQLSQPVSSRILCCRLLGKLCTKFQPYVIKKEIVPMVQCLCQDVNPDVRATMCSQLDFVARGIGLESSRSAVLPELVELAQDEAAGVRRAAVRALAAMAPLLSHEDGRTTLAPLLRKCCSQALASLDPLVLPCLARALGALCRALAACLSSTQQSWFLQYYCQLARLGVSQPLLSSMPDLVPQAEKSDLCLECRIACAFNMPAMAQFAGPSLFSDHLASLFSELCADPNPQVRAMMAAGFPEVQVCAGGASLLRELLTLLRDSSLQVIQSGLLEQLPRCVEAVPWVSLSHTERKETAGDLVQALLACEATLVSSYKWRLHAQLLSQLATLPERLPPSVVQPMLGPFLLSRVLTLRPLPCRLTAGYALLMLLRSCPTLAQRIALVTRIDAELCRGQSCHHRMLYVRLCELATQIFSWSFFRTHFFSPLLSLAGDGVANIRLRLCSLLAPLKACMQLPADSQLLAALEACVRRLMAAERDRDVMAALCHAIEELDQIEVPTMTKLDQEEILKQKKEEAFLVQEEEKRPKGNLVKGGHHSLPRPSPKIPVASKKYGTIPRVKQDSNKKSGIPRVGAKKESDLALQSRNVLRRASTPPPPSTVSRIPSLKRRSMVGN